MPLILHSPAYRSGHLLVVITFDEGSATDTAAGDNEQPGPGNLNPGYTPLLNTPVAAFGGKTFYQLLGITGLTPGQEPPAGTMPGGGRVGAVLLNPDWIKSGSVNTTRVVQPLLRAADLRGPARRPVWRRRRARPSRLRRHCV
jgi:hypothetical protein